MRKTSSKTLVTLLLLYLILVLHHNAELVQRPRERKSERDISLSDKFKQLNTIAVLKEVLNIPITMCRLLHRPNSAK